MATQPKPTPELRPQCLDVNQFIIQHGRPPMLERDPIAPYHYRGWLENMVQLCHYHPMVVNRWDYYFRTFMAGKLLDEPIPQMNFESQADPGARSMLDRCMDILFHEVGSQGEFHVLIDWLAWGMACSAEEPRLSEKTNEALYRQFNLEPLLLHPHDYFGDIYAEGKGRWNRTGFYPTPHTVVDMMTRMVMHDLVGEDGKHKLIDGRDSRTFSMCDPAIGTGRMALFASNYTLNIYGMDIDQVCCKATQINGILYAPWITRPLRFLQMEAPARLDQLSDWRVDDTGQCRLFNIEDFQK